MIDHTTLKAGASKEVVTQITEEARKYHSYSVCINPAWVALVREQLQDEPAVVCTVIGSPLGVNISGTKTFETTDAINSGADEVDMVINIGTLKSKDNQEVQKDIEAVVEAAKDCVLVKVTIETPLLDREKIIRAYESARAAGADLVKTSTGLSTGGARVGGAHLTHETVRPEIGVKVSGGTYGEEEAMTMVEAGATRIGASIGIAIISGSTGRGY